MSEGDNNSGEGQTGNNSKSNVEGNSANTKGDSSSNGNGDRNANAGLSQEQYEKRIAELDKRDKAMEDKLKRMETLNEKITAEGSPTGGQAQPQTEDEKQKATIIKNFGGCIDGLDKMI